MKNMNNQEKNTYVRQHILSALLELMHTQDFVSISIQALVDAAGVGRASFYRNFASKEDVLQQESVRLTNEWKTNFDHEHPDGTPGQDNLWLVSLLDFYKDHAEFYLALYHAGLSNIMLETLLGYFDRSPEIPNGLAYLNSAIGYMLYGWVHEWMNRGMQESGTEIARMFAEAQKKQAKKNRAHPIKRDTPCFAILNLLSHGSRLRFSNIPSDRHSESNPHSQAGHCR